MDEIKTNECTTANAWFGVRRADVLGGNIVPIFPPERQAAGTLAAMRDSVGTFLQARKNENLQ
jgi:hypothetical protein